MRLFTHKTTTVSIEYPPTWDPSLLEDVTIQIADIEGNELLAATSATLYDEVSISVASSRYSSYLTLEDGYDELKPRDLIKVSGVLGYENHIVKGWDDDNLKVELEGTVDRDFEVGATVHRLSAIAEVDLSDTDTFPAGTQLVITWTPTGTGDIITEMAEIETASQIDIAGFTREFMELYHRAYKALKSPVDRYDTFIRLAQDELRDDLRDRNPPLDIARIKDQRLISPPLMAKVAEMWARDGDEGTNDEYQKYTRVYSASLERLCRNPIWVDSNDDGIQDDGEVDSYPIEFEKDW